MRGSVAGADAACGREEGDKGRGRKKEKEEKEKGKKEKKGKKKKKRRWKAIFAKQRK